MHVTRHMAMTLPTSRCILKGLCIILTSSLQQLFLRRQCPEGTVRCCWKGVSVSSSSCNAVRVSGSCWHNAHMCTTSLKIQVLYNHHVSVLCEANFCSSSKHAYSRLFQNSNNTVPRMGKGIKQVTSGKIEDKWIRRQQKELMSQC